MDCTNFREDATITFEANAIPVLRIGDAFILTKTFEARIADLFHAFLHTTEERLNGQIDPHLNVLQHLRMHQLERRALFFLAWEHRLSVVHPAFDAVLVGKLACFKRLVVDPPACFQHRVQDTTLAVLQVDTVFVGLAHILRIAQVNINRNIVRL
jgi:hypothetical protein